MNTFWTVYGHQERLCFLFMALKTTPWYELATSLYFLIAMVTANDEVKSRAGAAGHFTPALYEVVNLAPCVTSFSTRLMASWQLYSLPVLWVVMQHNYTKPNLMNQVNVPPAPFTSVAPDHPSLFWGSNGGFHSVRETQAWTLLNSTACG